MGAPSICLQTADIAEILCGARIAPLEVVKARTPYRIATIAAFSMATLVVADVSRGQETLNTEHALQQFDERVAAYVALRTRAAASVPPVEVLSDMARIQAQIDGLAGAIRSARRAARPGDLFAAEVRLVLRIEIRDALAAAGIAVEDLRAALEEEAEPGADVPFVGINEPYPWAFGSAVPPMLIDALPALPVELQYRFIGRDLLLIDVEADLVVDTLPQALPLGRPPHLSLC